MTRNHPRKLPLFAACSLLALHADGVRAEIDADLYASKCGRCHRVFAPTEYTSRDWPGLVRSMKEQAGLSREETETITEYLVNEAGDDSEGQGIPGPATGGYLYTEYFQTPEKTSNFDIHYLSIHISGWAAENIAYLGEFELEHGGKGDNTFVEQAYIDYWFLPTVAVKIGAILAPFNRFDEVHDPLGNQLITRPQVSREIGVSAWKDVGVDLHGYVNVGEHASASFDLYTINGLGSGANLRGSRQYRDNNEDKAFGGRVNVVLHDRLELGASAYRGAWDDDGKNDVTMFGAHGKLNTPVADLFAEFASAKSENPGEVADGDMSGYFVQLSRLIASRFRPAVRLGSLDYLDEGDALGRDPEKGNRELNELALGFAYYPVSKVVFKIEYTFFDEGDRVAEKDNDQLGLQAAVRF